VLTAIIENASVFHRQHAVRMSHQPRIVTDAQHGGAVFARYAMQQVDHHLAVAGIQRTGGFVGEQQLRLLGQRPCHRNRCFSPPDISAGRRCMRGCNPTSSSVRIARARATGPTDEGVWRVQPVPAHSGPETG
jgi:hypothetical protein